MIRKACVYAGITVNPDLAGIDGFPTLTTEWDALLIDDVTDLGTHTFGASSYSYSIASGDASISSLSGDCADIAVGSENSVINVSGTFCLFNGCEATPGKIVVNTCAAAPAKRSTSAFSGLEESTVELYPNPTTGEITLTLNTTSDEEVSVVVYDLSGKAHMTLQNGHLAKGTHRMKADLSTLATGTYIVQVTSASENKTIRVVKTEK